MIVSVVVAIVVAVMFGKQLAGPVAKNAPRPGRYPLLEGLIAFAMWVSLLVLAGTGFLGAIVPGHPLQGFTTLAHVGFGAMFGVCFALLAVFRAEAYSLAGQDTHGRFSTVQKYCFWIIALCGLALIFSILSAMLRLLGTDGQHVATLVHRYSALVAMLAVIIYAGARKRS